MMVAPLVILIALPALIALFSHRKTVAAAPESAFEPAE
jgi:cobalt-zinc-cadmium resistance protein CzcA